MLLNWRKKEKSEFFSDKILLFLSLSNILSAGGTAQHNITKIEKR